MIKSIRLIFAWCLIFVSINSFAQQKRLDASSVISYILDHQKENGAFGPDNKEYTDLAWNYPAIGTLKLLGAKVPREKEAFENGNKSWMEIIARKNGPWYWSFFQKAHLYNLFHISNINFEEGIKRGQYWEIKFKSRKNYLELPEYKEGLFFDIPSLWHMIGAISLLDGKVTNKFYIEKYLRDRQAENGAFVDDIKDKPTPTDSETNLIVTSNAVLTLKSLESDVFNAQDCVKWLQSCQAEDGGFKYSPESSDVANQSDVWYTWAALKALKALGSEPKNVKKCIEWLNSLQNYDGGFGDRPGWNSRIYSTFYAVSALSDLTGDAVSGISLKKKKNT
ncbi:hypothetical protein D9O36_14220 [Zobellia amurskyensis]|uniref:Geranylgeranyl transferase type II subunit beta n=1 Tax=Zobellia amurskyensis TaxID=248905 RepID=A0A7X2ZV65_9FLAO|nr:prenyltransferase/squalene oxidase repeat-containing protein [Zobellia amurskyensis]MUH37003.1 hypothetical protein [Zobellia amurskyensis]